MNVRLQPRGRKAFLVFIDGDSEEMSQTSRLFPPQLIICLGVGKLFLNFIERFRRAGPIWEWGRWTWSLELFVTLLIFAGGIEEVPAELIASGYSPAWDLFYGEYMRN